MNNKYTEEYFKTVNYANYLDREAKYLKTAEELNDLFKTLLIIDKESSILDYGCAVGFLISAFSKMNYKNVYGYDISEWAVKQAKNKGLKILDMVENTNFDLVFFLDVLEHMKDEEITYLFQTNNFKMFITRIPCAEESDPRNFFLNVSRRDETHINCKTKNEWKNFFNKLGYKYFFKINTNTIYDSEGCFCFLIIR